MVDAARGRGTNGAALRALASHGAAGVLLFSLLACESWPGRTDEPSAPEPAAATLDGEVISLVAVDDQIRRALFEEAFGDDSSRLYTARRETIDEMIDARLLERAAEAAGQSPEAYLGAAVSGLPPISDAEVQQIFDDNRDRLPAEASVEGFEDQIRAHLERERLQEVVEQLRGAATISVSLPRERAQVEPIGPSLGPADAPITIVEFSDFQCPFCARAVPVINALRERYPDEVRIVYRHLPLSFHSQARIAAIAAVCAQDQERFWEFHDQLFENQKALEREDLLAVAEGLDLDISLFAACLDDPAPANAVDIDVRAAAAVGATGTPTFFVNGLMLTGAQPIDRFEAVIEEERELLAAP